MSNKDMKNKDQRGYKLTKEEGQWWECTIKDSYGEIHTNFFETKEEANKWVYHVWETEDWFHSVDKAELLANAIADCKRIDEASGRRSI